jgi:hypothetical protein
MSEIGADKLAKVYIKMRDHLQALQREYEEKEADVKAQMEIIEQKLLDICKDTGADSIKTAYGTVMRSTKTRYWPSDWASMYEFIRQHDAYDLLERRVHQTNMKTWLEENPSLLPQGLNAETRYSVTVRRSK